MKDEERVGPESVEAGLRAVFGNKRAELESVPGILGVDSVVLRADGEGPVPVRKVRPGGSDAVGDRRYHVLGEIARGGVGVIFESRDKDLSREVALKVLRPEFAARPDVLARFIEEAQVGGQLQHPGIVPVYGLGLQPDGRPYFAMKLVRGRTLSAILGARTRATEERRHLIGVFEQICQTMAYAHARGVIHRDLKPSNVMVGAFGEVQVVDWGFAKVLGFEERAPRPEGDAGTAPAPGPDETVVATVRSGASSSHSLAGSVMGTPAYMPPEQALGQIDEIDERADVFTLGGILCEVLTGKPPYTGDANEMLTAAAQGSLGDAQARLDGCGAEADLVDLAKQCLAPDPDDRPHDAGVVAHAVQQHLADAEERARKLELAAAEERAHEVEEQAQLARRLAEVREEEARVVREKRQAEKERARQREERTRAAFERKARTRSLAVAATLLVAVGSGVGGVLWSQAEASAREREIEARVSSALQQAGEHEGSEDWSKALAAANNALNLARDATPETRERARAIVEHLRQAKRDAEAADRLREDDAKLLAEWVRVVREPGYGANDARLVALFARHGIDVADPAAAAARVLASERRAEIAAVLDTWAFFRRTRPELAGSDWKALLEIAKKGDPDGLRNRVRDAAVTADAAALPAVVADVKTRNPPAETRVLLGLTLYQFGRHLEAVEVMREAVLVHPDSDEAHHWLGMVLNTLKPPLTQVAARHGAATVALRPGNRVARLFAAFLAGDYPAAVRICDAILAEDPDNAFAQNELASALWHMRDWKRAVPALRRVIELNDQDVYAWFNLAWALYSSGDLAGALAVARDSEKILPATPQARALQLGALSLYFGVTGDYEQGIAKAKEAVAAAPDDGRARWCLGTVLRRAGRPRAAAEALRKSLELGPSADAHTDLALVLRDADPDAALSHLRRAVALDPAQAEHHARLAAFRLWQRADPERALQDATRALQLDGNNARAWNVLARTYWMKGEMASYERYARQIQQGNPTAAAANLNLAALASHRLDHATALQWIDRALAQADATPAAQGLRGACLLHLGRFADGLAALRTCVERAPAEGTDDCYRAPFRDRIRALVEAGERVVACAARKDLIVRGELEPDGPDQALAFADLCYFAGAFGRAADLYRRAQPEDRHGRRRAAFAAARTGPAGRARALGLLRAELEALGDGDPAAVRRVLWDWKRAPLLAPVRDPLPLARLPDAEREGWVPFWLDVDARLERSLEAE